MVLTQQFERQPAHETTPRRHARWLVTASLHMYQLDVAGGDGGTENTFCSSMGVRRIDFILHTHNVDVAHSGPSDVLDLGSDHRSVCAHCKLAEVPCNRRSNRRVQHKWLSREYVPKYQATIAEGLRLSTPQSFDDIESFVVQCANAAAKEPQTPHPTPWQQLHFQSLLDLRRRCRDKRERCRLSKLIRSGLRREMRRRRNARLNEVLLEFRDLNRLESIRHDALNKSTDLMSMSMTRLQMSLLNIWPGFSL